MVDAMETPPEQAPRLKRTLDYPPIWLLAALGLAWLLRGGLPRGGVIAGLGWALIAVGVGLMIWAVIVMARHRTTVIPHLQPTALVTRGPFSLSRNPIYLGDAFTLAGFALLCGSLVGLFLVPAFMVAITRRFILAEEARLRDAFGAAFTDWSARVRRWL